MPISVDTGHCLSGLRDECKRLRAHLEARNTKDTMMMQAKRDVTQSKEAVARTKALWDNKIATEKVGFESSRRENAERMERYEKRLADDAKRIKALEQEVAALKAAAAARAPAESLPSLLRRLNLESHLAALEEEELDVGLLRSRGRDVMCSNMAELGLAAPEVARLADDLFPP